MAPHGVYPVPGDDRWIAVACVTDEAWRPGRRARTGRPRRPRRHGAPGPAGRARRAGGGVDRAARGRRGARPAAGARDRRPPGAEQPRVPGRPAARPPGPLRDRRAPLLGPVVVEGPRFRLCRTPGVTGPARPTASTPPRCSPACSATTTTASPSSPPPAGWADIRGVPTPWAGRDRQVMIERPSPEGRQWIRRPPVPDRRW